MDELRKRTFYTRMTKGCLDKYRMQTQIAIIQTAIFLTILSLILTVYVINGLISQQLIFEASQQLLLNETSKHQSIVSQKLQWQVNQQFNNRFNILDNINQLYQFIDQTPIEVPQQQPCNYTANQVYKVIQNLGIFCYFYSNNTVQPFVLVDQIEDHNLMSVIGVLNQFLISFQKQHTNEILFISLNREDSFIAVTPQNIYFSSFRTHTRPWYIQHMEHISEKPQSTDHISSIYQVFSTKRFELTQTRSLQNSDSNLIGVMGYNNNFQGINFNFTGLIVMLLDPNGRILYSNAVFSPPVDYTQTNTTIYNESLTGFTDDDWAQMQSQALNKISQSNCEVETSSLCRYNERFRNPVTINIFDYRNSFYILVLSNLTQTEVHQNYSDQLQIDLFSTYRNYFYLFIAASGVLFLLSFYCLRVIFHPLIQIQQYVQLCVSQRFTLSLQIIKYKQGSNNIFDNLTNTVIAFWPKLQRGNEKSLHCKIIEQFKYPSNSRVKLNCGCKELENQFTAKNIEYMRLTKSNQDN